MAPRCSFPSNKASTFGKWKRTGHGTQCPHRMVALSMRNTTACQLDVNAKDDFNILIIG
jgi:hypothetical protein